MEDLSTNPELIQHYDLLKRTGIIDHIDNLHIEINNLETLFTEAWEITSKHSIDEIIEYVINQLLGKFVPSFFTVIIQVRAYAQQPEIMCYKNIHQVDIDLPSFTLEPFKDFFLQYPSPISFSLFEYQLNDKKATDSLLPFSPEILVPIIGFWGLYGLIIIGTKLLGQEYTPEEITYLGRLMKFTSIGIQNNIHHESSITDLKTGLYNHSFFNERLQEELARIKRHRQQLSLFMMDIDHFKTLNDTHGHLAGDEVLISISKILFSLTRREDVVARFGGEEFVILATEISKETAWNVAERIRTTIEKEPFQYDSKTLSVTVSIGIRHVNSFTLEKTVQLLSDADEALYASKKWGRNRTTFYNPGLLFKAASIAKPSIR